LLLASHDPIQKNTLW